MSHQLLGKFTCDIQLLLLLCYSNDLISIIISKIIAKVNMCFLYVRHCVLTVLSIFSHLILKVKLETIYHYPHFTEK